MKKEKVVLAYSGGLDTSVAIKWLMQKYSLDVITLTVDIGQGINLDEIKNKAENLGVEKAYVLDLKEEFVKDYIIPAIKSNAMYERVYPLATALSRPLIAKYLVKIAKENGAKYVAHGCTGKGNDQVRIDLGVKALAPDLEIIAPVREWNFSREEEIEYALENNIPIPVSRKSPYSIDENLWGRSIEGGILEDPWQEPPEDIYLWTRFENREPSYIEITFERGVPVELNGVRKDVVEIIEELNKIAGSYGIGRIDHIENRLVGIKSREIYEAPAAIVIIRAHEALEDMVLPRELAHYKKMLEDKYAELVYYGLWFDPFREALQAFMDKTQDRVTGKVKIKLLPWSFSIVGRESPYSLYDHGLATYDKGSTFSTESAVGFIKLFGLQNYLYALKGGNND
ncbi:argininosuccinate synthase [Dictyoglomus thermophilum]|uniref:Argininosuccinate synthase n=2 Tax=Dictyoglomus thermophilum TaxID=14 RepID=ASSY_DICT6|nr:argininosuccinate synthase [Dictyoglomus thermophilum]B5YAL9.1 RecName: Full=Argininosuccinate synthase; AltName: Full=Citrulline--aspartate ligase [Dictyoglomus thermophilum H-6-12]ACI19694.1 argininosuccinate synthase [Dictyoglomus thermophilum H-6-12]MCX7720545.1 argininosuccinate synthase [Dictyoglomus thermophilum]TYT24299.1 argininosuccinate synthase [Dictyoglomus thermophilum]